MKKFLIPLSACVLGAVGCVAPQHTARITLPAEKNAPWQEECGGCHALYPPMMLTKSNWQEMMAGLDQHFGVDARLDAAPRKEIGDFLAQNAASDALTGQAARSLRITDTEYFRRAHAGSSIPIWKKNGDTRKASECSTCHKTSGDDPW